MNQHFNNYKYPYQKNGLCTNPNILLRLFPSLNNMSDITKLKIDKESISYITPKEKATRITQIIIRHMAKLNIDVDDIIATDATACIGGNTISFAKMFKHVYAIEIDKKRTEYLKCNLDTYNLCKKVTIINDDCTKVLSKLDNHNIIFLDPPWGGKMYKQYTNLQLYISNMTIEKLCNQIMDNKIMKCTPNIIVIKLPVNYNIQNMHKTIKSDEIYLHNLKKMFILVIINKNI